MTVSAYELASPDEFKKRIAKEFEALGSLEQANVLFCRRYMKLKRTTASIKFDFAKEVFIELFGVEPSCESGSPR